MTCDLTSRLDDEWMLEEAQPETRELLGSKVVRVEHVGTYACRTVAGRSSLSQHAFAKAIDIGGMTLADGARLTIGGDRPDTGPRGAFMRRVGRAASSAISLALTPEHSASHSNHFHLATGRYFRCGF